MIFNAIMRAFVVGLSFFGAVLAAVAALALFGTIWTSAEIRAAAPDDPLISIAAEPLGLVIFLSVVGPALTLLPGLFLAVFGEVARVRSWAYYIPAGGAAMAAIPLLAGPPTPEGPPIGHIYTLFAAAGFVGGLVYWVLAGRRA